MDGQISLVPMERIERAIIVVRGEKVMLDSELAEIYGVETKVLNQAVKRNASRFPEDFMFRLTADEVAELNRSQIVTGSQKHRDPRFPPYAFAEHGALMLANVLNSERAAQMRAAQQRQAEGCNRVGLLVTLETRTFDHSRSVNSAGILSMGWISTSR
jgi:hypothetical protein